MLTYSKVNKELRNIDSTAELVRGDGYHYFVANSLDFAYSTSVMVPRLNNLTIDQWIQEFLTIRGHK